MSKATNIIAGAVALCCAAGAATAAAPFYEGKTITFIVGNAAGGGSDLSCRLIAQYMPKYIAGNPTIIVKIMPSPDAISAVNYVANEAKNDGTTLLCGVYGPDNQLTGNPALKTDLSKFNYISGDGDSAIVYVRSEVPPGMKTRMDVFKAKPEDLILAGFAVNSTKDIEERLGLEVMGLDKYRYVTGYAGSGAVRAALNQKFVNLFMEAMSPYVQSTVPTMVKAGELTPLYQRGVFASGARLPTRDPRVADVPTLGEFYQERNGRAPSGPVWDLAMRMGSLQFAALYALMLPPGAPAEAVSALRAAVAPMNGDPGYDDAADKLKGAGIREASGEQVAASISSFLNMPADVKALYLETIKSGEGLLKTK